MSAEETVYPDAEDIFNIHEDIVANDSDTARGVKSPGAIDGVRPRLKEFAMDSENVDIDRVVSYCRQHTTEA